MRFSLRCTCHLLCTRAGNLLTVSKKLHMQPRESPQLTLRRLLNQQPPADASQHSSAGSHPHTATTISTAATSLRANHNTSQLSFRRSGQFSNSSVLAAEPDVEHILPERYLTPGNQLVGGVFLHLTRKTSIASCSPLFSQKLSQACHYDKIAGNDTTGADTYICCEKAWTFCGTLQYTSTIDLAKYGTEAKSDMHGRQ
jgi:hypothetical protein